MIRLEILSGAQKGAAFAVAQFPIFSGRATNDAVRLEDLGVWEHHCTLQREGVDIFLEARADSLLNVNGVSAPRAHLRNGDIIDVGNAKVLFTFTAVRQTSLQIREWITWSALAAIAVGEVALAWALR